MTDGCITENLPKAMKDVEKERAVFAKKVYCNACEEIGIKACSFESSAAWREFVDGRIEESELSERAREEMKDFKKAFSKYTIVTEEEEKVPSEDAMRKHRARLANKIYKEVCSESGLSECFFNGFAAWSDYVQGRIGDAQLMERAKSEAAKMVDSNP